MATLTDLPRIFQDSGYERDVLARIGAVTPKDRNVDPHAAEELTRAPSAANTLARVFFMARTMPRETVESALSAPLCRVLLEEGLLVDAGGGTLRATCSVVPARGFWCLRDFDAWALGHPVPGDHVLGVGTASVLLADFTVRRTGERVLDMGTGQGFQAAMAAKHAASVVGVDINPRPPSGCLGHAHQWPRGKRGRWHGRRRVAQGDFFTPVEQDKGTFDLIVSNPPFVIAPPHDLTAIGGRWIGDFFVEQLITRAPEFLCEGGWSTVLCSWHHPTPADWDPRPISWVTGKGVDAWIVKLQTDDSRAYAASWLRNRQREENPGSDEGPTAATTRKLHEWLDYYQKLGVGAISMGVVYLRKRTPQPGATPNWVRTDAWRLDDCTGTTGAQAQRLFAAETVLRGLASASDVLDQRLAICPASELVQHLRPAQGQWAGSEAMIRQTEGFAFPIALGPLPATILARLDGSRTAREVIREIASGMKADPAVAYGQTAPFLAKMLQMTHLAVA